jgi:hypothetical protein
MIEEIDKPPPERFPLDQLERLSLKRLPGYLDACRACAVEITDDAMFFDPTSPCYVALASYRIESPPPTAAPMWASPPSAAAQNGPGTLVKKVLVRLGFETHTNGVRCPNGTMLSNCNCEGMRQQMDQWGWSGCLLRVGQLKKGFTEKARACGVEVDAATVVAAIRAAWAEIRGCDSEAELSEIGGIENE